MAFIGPILLEGPNNFLGSGRRWSLSREFPKEMSIANIVKGMPQEDYFGAPIKGQSNLKRGTEHLDLFFDLLMARIRIHVPTCYFGGTLIEILSSSYSTPIAERYDVTVGQTYFSADADGMYEGVLVNTDGTTWSPFVATDHTVSALKSRQRALEQYVFDLLFATSTGHYHELARLHRGSRCGSDVIAAWKNQFLEDQPVSVMQRAEELRSSKYHINGAENPAKKMGKVISE